VPQRGLERTAREQDNAVALVPVVLIGLVPSFKGGTARNDQERYSHCNAAANAPCGDTGYDQRSFIRYFGGLLISTVSALVS
jgi:hypothetical protein